MQKLHLVGFTTDHEGLILSARRGARSGSYLLTIDDAVEEAVDERRARREEESDDEEISASTRRTRVESALPVREIQARLRQGRSIAEVARAAGVDADWVERFAPPVLAERAQVIRKVRSVPLRRARLGPSVLPIEDAVRHHLADRGVSLTPDEFAAAWTARQVAEGRWAVRFTFHHRGHDQVLRFDLDESTGEVSTADRVSSLMGYVAPRTSSPTSSSAGRSRPSKPADEPRPVAKRAVVSTGFRPEPTGKAVSRSAKEREKAAVAMRKAAAKRAVEGERAAARLLRERRAAAARREREEKAAAARAAREALAAQRAAAEAALAKKAAAKQAAAARKAAKQAPAASKPAAAKVGSPTASTAPSTSTRTTAKRTASKPASTAAKKIASTAAKRTASTAAKRTASTAAKKTATKAAKTASKAAKKTASTAAKRPASKATARMPSGATAVKRTATQRGVGGKAVATSPPAKRATTKQSRTAAPARRAREAPAPAAVQQTTVERPAPRPGPRPATTTAAPAASVRSVAAAPAPEPTVRRAPALPRAAVAAPPSSDGARLTGAAENVYGTESARAMFRRGLVEQASGDVAITAAPTPPAEPPSNGAGLATRRTGPDRPRRTRPLRAT